ncbi:hypothetical protein SHKM778_47140 [Streptomyces sp. KM77-8]|uniref:DUF1205 domain-containing protein n=1 Tax=Streptomyces haneummycinicus TaxID=3074435 RepID=A0AAT9HLD9_9ACTN
MGARRVRHRSGQVARPPRPRTARSHLRVVRGAAADRLRPARRRSHPPGLHIDAPGPSLPLRYVPYNGPGVVPSWVLEPPSRPRVCVTWGTFTSTATDQPDMFLVPTVLDALAELDVEPVVAVTGAERELLGEVGDRARIVQDLPIHTVLPSCSAVIHHGGATTVLSAARFGVPQLTMPHLFEQRLNSDLLEAVGACAADRGARRRRRRPRGGDGPAAAGRTVRGGLARAA